MHDTATTPNDDPDSIPTARNYMPEGEVTVHLELIFDPTKFHGFDPEPGETPDQARARWASELTVAMIDGECDLKFGDQSGYTIESVTWP